MSQISKDEAERIATQALLWLAQEPDLFSRFCNMSGIEPSQIRIAASEPGFLAGVMQFILAHEPTLRKFADETNTPIQHAAPALHALPGGDTSYDQSI